jgi:hypothetical protein
MTTFFWSCGVSNGTVEHASLLQHPRLPGFVQIIKFSMHARKILVKAKGICTPRALMAHLIGSKMSITGTVQPGNKHLHSIFA